MEITITLHTEAGDVITSYSPDQLTEALACIKAYIEDGKTVTVTHGRVF